jgi:hypothetical protein
MASAVISSAEFAFSVKSELAVEDEDENVIVVHFGSFVSRDNLGLHHRLGVDGKSFQPSQLPFWEKLRRRVERRILAVWPCTAEVLLHLKRSVATGR